MEKLSTLHSIPSPTGHLCGLAWVDGHHIWCNDYTGKKIRKVEMPR